MTAATLAAMAEAPSDATRLASEARDRVRFEEEALGLSDQVYRVARHLAIQPGARPRQESNLRHEV